MEVVLLFFLRVAHREMDVDSLLLCSSAPLHSGLSVVRDPTTGMLLDFTEVAHTIVSQTFIQHIIPR